MKRDDTSAAHEYRLLGGLAVDDANGPVDLGTPKQRAVLAVLLLDLGHVVAVDRLLRLLWDDGSDKALSSLQVYVSRLRSALEPRRRPRDPAAILLSQPPGYCLAGARTQVDLYRFEDAVGSGLESLRARRPTEAAEVLDAALRLWTGPVLPELADEPFVIAAAQRAENLRVTAVEGAGQAHLELGNHRAAVNLLERESANHPARERMHRLLALALYRSERQVDALAAIDRCRRALRDTAGLDPGPEMKRLESDMLAQSPALDWHTSDVAISLIGGSTAALAPADEDRQLTTRPPEVVQSALVGRHAELDTLSAALDAATRGQGSAVVLIGEPGIGKTRLAESVVESASSRAMVTAWARCSETRSAPPFWVITQVADQLGRAGVDLHLHTDDDGGDVRFPLYRSIVEALEGAGRSVLAVIDDLQWADPDSLRLLEYLAPELRALGVLLVATTRPLTVEAPEALVDCLAELARVPGSARLALTGLGIDDVERWLSLRTDVVVPLAVAELVHERAGGNPLFIKEVTELLAAEGRLADEVAVRQARAIPPGVQFVVRRRVSRLPRETQLALGAAAVVGVRFALDTAAAANAMDLSSTLDALAPAFDAGLLVETDGEIGFSHALVAEALASEVNAARRAAIHAAAARSLAARAGTGSDTHAAAIAHHALEGLLAGTGELAIETSIRAAELAFARYAYEDSATHFGNAALALLRCRPGDSAARIDALIGQATALMRADRVVSAKRPILAAIEGAEAAGNIDAMAAAGELLTHSRVWANQAYGVVDEAVVVALERTLARLPADTPPGRRAHLLGAVASELVFADRVRHTAAVDAALGAARATGDPEVLARVLSITMVPNRPDELDLRRMRAAEIVKIAETHGLPPDLQYAGHHHSAECHVERGEFAAAQHHIDRCSLALASMPGTHLSAQHAWFATAIATATARYDTAEELVAGAYELHRRGRRYDAEVLYLASRCGLALDLGGFEEILEFATQAAATTSYRRALAESIAFGALEVGRPDLARALVAPFGPDAGFPDDYTTVFCATAALHVRVELGDREGAAAAAVHLEPFADRWAEAGTMPYTMGFAALALARHDALCGDVDRARERFGTATMRAEESGAVAWLARGLVHQGAFLVEIGDEPDGREALARAGQLAERHRFPYVSRRLSELAR